jgi:Peptidase M50B-like
MSDKARRLTTVAVHEAGHAVASYHLGTPLRHVTIDRDKSGKTLGHTRQRWVWFEDKQGERDGSPRGRDRVERHTAP